MKRFLTLLTILLTVISVRANPADNLLERIDAGASRKFKTELVRRRSEAEPDFFELDQAGRRVVVRGNSWVNIAVGINWYLKHYAHIHLSWNQMTCRLPASLPPVATPERHETQLRLRYDFNYCTFSYSMAWWDWDRWQREIDWMALHGVNLPLAIVGEECVWRNMLLRLGYTDEEVGRFIAGPAFLAWWEMNNLEGWGGPLPPSWYMRQESLQKQILARMKELGMKPVLPGYSGMMPHDARERLGLNVTDGGLWNGYQRPANLMPTDPRFAEIADVYYQELTRLYGKADYYSMDPFHESHDDAAIDYAAAGQAVMQAMKRTNANATWVVQGWTENPRPQMMASLRKGDLLILDLFSECRPMFGIPSIWQREKGYEGYPWLFCLLENFGANVGLHGRMDQLIGNFLAALSLTSQTTKRLNDQTTKRPNAQSPNLPSNLQGIGFTMEGSENNPVMFELMSELPWLLSTTSTATAAPTTDVQAIKEQWLRRYVVARYGQDNPSLQTAWELLAATIYNCPAGNNQQGPHESIFCGRPGLNNFQASSWSKMKNYYDPDDTRRAALLFASVADEMRGNNNYEYDLVDIARQALADQARVQYHRAIAAYKSFSRKDFRREAGRFLAMLLMQDSLLATRTEFRLGHWTEAARRCGSNAAESDQYEWNARTQITTWGNRTCADKGGLRDYAHKEWQGLLRDFYFVRWQTYFDALEKQMEAQTHPQPELLGTGPNSNKTAAELFKMALPQEPSIDWYAIEEPWTLRHNGYPAEAEGSAVDVAKAVCRRFLSIDH